MTKQPILKQAIRFLTASPTPFHVVCSLVDQLENAGFKKLDEAERWPLKKGGSYYLTRGGGSLIAFRLSDKHPPFQSFRIIGAHTDSPALKIKPRPFISFKNYCKLGVEVYGAPILSTWFDRDLSIAGKVVYSDAENNSCSALIDFRRPLAFIPNLPIHLSSKMGETEKLNRQTELPPIFMQNRSRKQPSFSDILIKELKKQPLQKKVQTIHDADLILYDCQKPAMLGMNKEFLSAGRLDNQISCFAGLQALLAADGSRSAMLVCNDHEEIGSQSRTGAAGPFLKSVLERMLKNSEDYYRCVSRSVLVSVDNSHGVHPNYPHRFDENHSPILNQGPVLKINANLRYATNAETAGFFRQVCDAVHVPLQEFVNRSDLSCGSTIGPITSTNLGIHTLDIGVPTFAMHSIRETCGCRDIEYLTDALVSLFNLPLQPLR